MREGVVKKLNLDLSSKLTPTNAMTSLPNSELYELMRKPSPDLALDIVEDIIEDAIEESDDQTVISDDSDNDSHTIGSMISNL